MTAAIATFPEVGTFDARAFITAGINAVRWTVRSLALGLSAAAAVGVWGTCATVAGVWIVTATLSDHISGPVKTQATANTFAGTQFVALSMSADQRMAQRAPELSLDAKVARARALVAELAAAMPPAPLKPMEVAAVAPTVQAKAPPVQHVEQIPLPHPAPPRPEMVAERQTQPAPQAQPAPPLPVAAPKLAAPQVAAPAPAPEPAPPKVAALPRAETKQPATVDGRTAVYDISARTVFMPNGARLEAHSGLAEKMDNPRYIHVRMRGPTPPNVYNLTLREKLFHGVRAIRLNPVDERKMFGRDGMLAHTYMLGPSGQSNGCVSFKDYDKFLRAFLDGEVDRLVVVDSLNGAPPVHVARSGRAPASIFASTEPEDHAKGTW